MLLAPQGGAATSYGEDYKAPEAVPARSVERRPSTGFRKHNDKIKGYNGNIFYITRPAARMLKTVSSKRFGLNPGAADNTAALRDAFSYCKEHPGTRLVIEKGTYHFSQSSPISLEGLQNVFVDGSKAEFITDKTGCFLQIADCNCVEVRGLTVDWDREKDPIEDIVRVQNADKKENTLELVFFQKEDIDPGMRIAGMSKCDPETFIFGTAQRNKECYVYNNPKYLEKVEKIAPNVLKIKHSGCFSKFSDGETYILRHYIYDGQVFHIKDGSENITLDGIKFYGGPGMAVFVSNCSSHFQILNSTVGVDPALSARHYVSLGADAFHFLNTRGCFRVAGCDVSRQGDDAINVHDGLGYIDSVEGNVIRVYSGMRAAPGDTLRFKDEGYFDVDFEAVICGFDNSQRPIAITLDRDVSDAVKPAFTAWDTAVDSKNYVIENNYFHENRARGLLLQSSEGVCRGNRFYKIQGMAIRVVMDIRPKYWQEGTGVNGLTICGNTIEGCDFNHWGCQIELSTHIDGRPAENEIFRNIEILSNTVSDFNTPFIKASNVNGLVVRDNTIQYSGEGPVCVWGAHCINIATDE